MSDASILRTFWTAGVIQFGGLLIALYFARAFGKDYKTVEMLEPT
jgi:hypothetical protein